MLVSAPAPFDPASHELRALYVSLNSPVVTLEALPSGPASATVALHPVDPAGATLSIRSVRTGQVAYFISDLELEGGSEMALDAALSFAEGMGFLFDEDEVETGGADAPRAAVVLWRELIGEAAAAALPDLPNPPAPVPAPAPWASAQPDAPPEADAGLLASVPGFDPARVLSKFRRGVPLEQALESVALRTAAMEGPPAGGAS